MTIEITSFDILFDRFYKRLEQDEEFFEYYNVDIKEAQELASERSKGYLIEVLDGLSAIGELEVDFSDYDEELEQINFKTHTKENKLIVNLMFQEYMEKDIPKLHAFTLNFTPSDLTVFSPANERTSYLNLINKLNYDNEIALDDYKNRDRKTGKLKNTINYAKYGDY